MFENLKLYKRINSTLGTKPGFAFSSLKLLLLYNFMSFDLESAGIPALLLFKASLGWLVDQSMQFYIGSWGITNDQKKNISFGELNLPNLPFWGIE